MTWSQCGGHMAEIERAAVQDVLTIKELLRETWHDTYGSLLPKTALETITSQWHVPELLTQQLQDPEIYFAIARGGGVVAGVITARRQDDVIVVNRLYVRPQYQRRGIGRQLLESSHRTFHDAQRVRSHGKAVIGGGQCRRARSCSGP